MKNEGNVLSRSSNRRSFLKGGTVAAGAATLGAALPGRVLAFERDDDFGSQPTKGDIAILRFLAAAEIIESDLWTQYAELGGIGSNAPIEVDPNQTLNNYQIALSNLDGDGPQYIASNTLDEVSHANFLNAYLASKGAEQVSLEEFRNLPGSTAPGTSGKKRITNLMNLNVDTSWFVRYRSTKNPDFGATFPQAITLNGVTAIPRNPGDLTGTPDPQFPSAVPDHIQAIANVAAFHFGAIEQGGTSLYATLSQKVTSAEVLRITLSIGGDEIAHFLEWVDFAGNGVQQPVAPFKDAITGLSFPDFFNNPPLQPANLVQPSLIFPVPCEFLHKDLGDVAIIRPTSDQNSGAVAAANGFINSGLFLGQSQKFLRTLLQLAEEADAAQRGF
jgi:TAT (twin-arginine translocation) pathway signal sequence